MGKYDLCYFWFVENNKLTDLQSILFSIMEQNHGKGKHSIYPALFEDWIMSLKDNQTLLRIVTRDISKCERMSQHTKNLLTSLAKIMFDPVKFAGVMDEHTGKDLLEMMPEGLPLYLMSNYDDAAFKQVTRKYPELIRKFRDIMISGKEHLMKPQEEIYKLAMSRWNITDPKSVLYIDDERENVQMAKNLGFETILYTNLDSAVLSIQGIIDREMHRDAQDTQDAKNARD